MKKTFLIGLFAFLLTGCINGQAPNAKKSILPVAEFAEKIKQLPQATIIDVRTPEEFSKGHLENARNYNWNGREFDQQISTLDKSKPVFVYCLSGGRSADAAHKMRSDGFSEVYEMSGGMMKWRAAGLPENAANAAIIPGMSEEQYHALLLTDKLVLVDFYADWCAPCKKMKPYLDEISQDMADKVIVIRINADDNRDLCKKLHIDALPVLHLYKNQSLIWTNTGFIEKAEVVKRLQ